MFIDAHIHLGMFKALEPTLMCAFLHQIMPVAVSTTLKEATDLIETLDKSSYQIPVFVGIHPWFIAKDNSLYLFEKLLLSKLVVGIGECGLDNKIDIPLKEQLELLDYQLNLAASYHLPVNLHVRGFHGQLHKILKSYQDRVVGIVHNTTFSKEVCKGYLDLGYKLSFGHHILFNQDKLNQVLSKVGISNILLETDFDYEHTGPYDETLLIKEYQYLSSSFKLELQRVKEQLADNFYCVIGKEHEFCIHR